MFAFFYGICELGLVATAETHQIQLWLEGLALDKATTGMLVLHRQSHGLAFRVYDDG